MNHTARAWLFAYTLCLALPSGGHGTPVHTSATSQDHRTAVRAHLFTSLLCPSASTQWHDHACGHTSL